ncbi:MAG: L-threonylcarbamoyladenylate synthase [Bacteroidales bacterium]
MHKEVRKAGELLQKGSVILYPTDTIWGIGCDATNPEAVARIYHIKQRSDRKSMLVLIDDLSRLSFYVEAIPDAARKLVDTAVKPTTIIYPGAKNLATNLIAPDGSIGIRITSDPFCRHLIRYTGKPIVSTSANISGRKAPTSFPEIDPEVVEQADYTVDWRKEEETGAAPSALVKVDRDGNMTWLRS